MEITLYIILLVYFLIGGIVISIVNKGKEPATKKYNWVKYFVYLVIVNALFASILFRPAIFHVICIIIFVLGLYEILNLTLTIKKAKDGSIALLILGMLSFSFYHFSLMPKKYLFYTLFMTTVFDAFSQLAGQLFGKRKMAPKISPNKTYEGLAGGLFFSLFTSMLIYRLLPTNMGQAFLLGLGMSMSALAGDLLASYCKRRFGIKDFSRLIPGHGGVLDRFDSLITSGSFMFVMADIFKL